MNEQWTLLAEDTAKLKIVIILAVGLAVASLLGYIAQRLKFSPILGFLIAGYLIGPFSPGIVIDLELSEQLAEIGVVLMMFGVGLHFDWKDLAKVKNIAIPGAIIQTLSTTLLGTALFYWIGWRIESGLLMGAAIGVASTVVLVRVLSDNNLLDTLQGHISVGWLIVEDILMVFTLVLLPTVYAIFTGTETEVKEIALSSTLVILKFLLLGILAFTVLTRFVKYVLKHVANTKSDELLTLTILALTFVVATISAVIFGASIALGAFIAGMVINKTESREKALISSLPLKDAFVAFFFLSIGTLFNPMIIVEHFYLFLIVLSIILIAKPLIAFLITYLMRYPVSTSALVAIALGQIGEFSFILSEEATKYDILPDEGYDIIVAGALISLAINPILFKALNHLVQKNP